MRWPSRGVVIRLFIYVPLIGYLGWQVMESRCDAEPTMAVEEEKLEDELAPFRRVITLPDGTQQEIVEMTPEQAEAILGHPIPDRLDPDAGDTKVEEKATP